MCKDSINRTAIFYEFIGTFLLTLTLSEAGVWGKESQSTPLHFDALVAFFTLWYLVIVTGRISYAQFNPALTIVWMLRSNKGHFKVCKYGIPYLIAQYLGALCGALITWWVKGQVAYPSVPENSNYAKAIVFQVLASFTLITMILLSSEKQTTATQIHAVNGLMIGLGLIVSIFISQGVSGAGINPAASFGTKLGEFFRLRDIQVMKDFWIYQIFPYIGGFVALLFHQMNVKRSLSILNIKQQQKSQTENFQNQQQIVQSET